MDMLEKALLANELIGLRAMISAASPSGGYLSQMNFPVTGPIVTITTLPPLADAMRKQADCMQKLVDLLEKVVATS
jgi:hypothetical protein